MRKFLLFIFFISSLARCDEANGWNALHYAVFNDNFKLAKKLIEKNHLNIDSKSKAGISPLHIAVKNRDLKMVKFLLKEGADIDIQDNNGLTPLHYAIGQRRFKIVKYLVLHDADVNIKNIYGISPLHQAAYSGDLDIVEFLLQAGADVYSKNNLKATPYDLAVAKRRWRVANYLLNYMRKDGNESKN